MNSYQLLKDVCSTYWMVRTDYPQSHVRSYVHDLVVQCMRTCGIDFQGDREIAAQIARDITLAVPKRFYIGNVVRSCE